MSHRIRHKQLLARREVVAAPAVETPRACTDRDFGLPPELHVATALLFLGFVSVLCTAFAAPGLLIPYAVFAIFIIAFFAVPAMWARMKPESRTSPLGWAEFRERGIETMTGRTPAIEAIMLVLILPFAVFMWSVAIAVIGHTVG